MLSLCQMNRKVNSQENLYQCKFTRVDENALSTVIQPIVRAKCNRLTLEKNSVSSVIVWVRVVTKNAVASNCRFDNLSRSHLLSLDFRSGCRNASHQQQLFSVTHFWSGECYRTHVMLLISSEFFFLDGADQFLYLPSKEFPRTAEINHALNSIHSSRVSDRQREKTTIKICF